MADFLAHVRSTGTRTTGASTPGDWSNDNCYVNVSATVAGWADDVTILLDDNNTIIETTHIKSSDFTGVTSLTISARSTLATWAANATIELFNAGPGGAGTTIEINNLAFTRTAPVTTGNARGLFYVEGTGCTAFTFNDCVFGDFAVDAWDPVSKYGLLYSSLSTVARTTTFNRCTYQNITTENPWHASLIRCGGNNQIFNFVDCVWSGNRIELNEDSIVGWGLFGENNAVISMTDCEVTDCVVTAALTTTMCRPFYYSGVNTVTINVDGITLTDCQVGDVSAPVEGNGWGFHVKGPYSIERLHSINCTYHYSPARDGGQLYFDTAAAVGLCSDISVENCASRSGVALFSSNGAGQKYSNIRAKDCTSIAGPVYSGGYGSPTFEGVLIDRCNITNDGVLFSRNNTEVQNKTTVISNCTIVNCTTAGSCAGIKIENNTVGFTMTATINNCISRNINTNDIEEDADSTVTTNDCNVANASSVTTDNNLTTVDPLFTAPEADNYTLKVNSPLIDIGSFWWGVGVVPPVGADGDPFPNIDISIGAYQSRDVPFHPTQL